MVALKKKTVFLVHGFETYDGKHSVHFGKDLNKPSNTKQFKKISDAKRFAINKARKIGVKSVLMDLPSGAKNVKIPMKNKKFRKLRKIAKKSSIFDIGL